MDGIDRTLLQLRSLNSHLRARRGALMAWLGQNEVALPMDFFTRNLNAPRDLYSTTERSPRASREDEFATLHSERNAIMADLQQLARLKRERELQQYEAEQQRQWTAQASGASPLRDHLVDLAGRALEGVIRTFSPRREFGRAHPTGQQNRLVASPEIHALGADADASVEPEPATPPPPTTPLRPRRYRQADALRSPATASTDKVATAPSNASPSRAIEQRIRRSPRFVAHGVRELGRPLSSHAHPTPAQGASRQTGAAWRPAPAEVCDVSRESKGSSLTIVSSRAYRLSPMRKSAAMALRSMICTQFYHFCYKNRRTTTPSTTFSME